MVINVCGRRFNTDTIRGITINSTNILIDAEEDFYRLHYTNESEIIEAKQWLKFMELSRKDLQDAVDVIVLTCSFFLNTKNQCKECPIKRSQSCFFENIPMNWK